MTDEKKPKTKVIEVDNGSDGTTYEKMEFPSNSHKHRDRNAKSDKKEKKVEKIIAGTARQKKKSLGKRMAESFFEDDIPNVGHYMLHDVIKPAAKSMLYDMISGGAAMSLFGETKGARTVRDRGKSYVSYNSINSAYNTRSGGRSEQGRREIGSRSRSSHNFDDIVLESRGEGEHVLSHLVDLVDDYGEATVADLYDLVGIDGNFTDTKYGWTNLASACVDRVRDGYVINLPKTIVLD